jgi:hypothetical protein
MVTAKTADGQILTVHKSDERLTDGTLVGNTKGLQYFNDGIRSYRLDPRISETKHLTSGRLWSASGRKWFNDGESSFFLNPTEAKGLLPGRLALKNAHLRGRQYFNDGAKTYRLHPDDARISSLVSGQLRKDRPRK